MCLLICCIPCFMILSKRFAFIPLCSNVHAFVYLCITSLDLHPVSMSGGANLHQHSADNAARSHLTAYTAQPAHGEHIDLPSIPVNLDHWSNRQYPKPLSKRPGHNTSQAHRCLSTSLLAFLLFLPIGDDHRAVGGTIHDSPGRLHC